VTEQLTVVPVGCPGVVVVLPVQVYVEVHSACAGAAEAASSPAIVAAIMRSFMSVLLQKRCRLLPLSHRAWTDHTSLRRLNTSELGGAFWVNY
jgi:hypothetical protein